MLGLSSPSHLFLSNYKMNIKSLVFVFMAFHHTIISIDKLRGVEEVDGHQTPKICIFSYVIRQKDIYYP
jgi:hypothetical protein